jgi:hypothetical protein
MAKETRQATKTIKRHLKAVARIGAVEIIPMTAGQAVAYCRAEYGFTPKLPHLHHTLNFYRVVWRHPIWKGELNEEEQQEIRKILEGPRTRHVTGNLNVTHHAMNGDGSVHVNRDGGVPRKGEKELPFDSRLLLFSSNARPTQPPLGTTDRIDPDYHCCTPPSRTPMNSSDQEGIAEKEGYDLVKLRKKIEGKLRRLEQSAPLRSAACSGPFACSPLASLALSSDRPPCEMPTGSRNLRK